MSEANPTAPKELVAIAEGLKRGEKPQEVSIRTLLSWFNAERRGRYVVQEISDVLAALKLVTEPPFTSGWIDTSTDIRLAPELGQPSAREDPLGHIHELQADGSPPVPVLPIIVEIDPTYRISNLKAANSGVETIEPDADISCAMTLMLQHDFSQLLVSSDGRTVKGMVSWKSIGRRIAVGNEYSRVGYCLEKPLEVDINAPLFDEIGKIVANDYVLVRGRDNKISSIVTPSDLSLQFRQDAEPFLLLGQIELHIRKLINNSVDPIDISEAKDENDTTRMISSIHDLTLGECIRLLEVKDNWTKLGLTHIDRKSVLGGLTRIRDFRNDIMHFSPDPRDPKELNFLAAFSNFLQRIDEARSK